MVSVVDKVLKEIDSVNEFEKNTISFIDSLITHIGKTVNNKVDDQSDQSDRSGTVSAS